MQKAGQRLSRSTQRSQRGVIIMILMICIGLASALLATVVPADVIPMILVLGIIALGISLAGSDGRAREGQIAETDIDTIVQALGQVAHGMFDVGETRSYTSAGARIECALREMTRQVGSQVGLLQHAAQSDVLTDMANRAHFERMVARELNERAPYTLSALLFIDIDRFKDINDALGHNLG